MDAARGRVDEALGRLHDRLALDGPHGGADHAPLGSLGLATRSPVAAALLALPILAAYLAAVTLAFAIRAVADCYARVVVACGIDATTLAQQVATAILGWVADLVVRIVPDRVTGRRLVDL